MNPLTNAKQTTTFPGANQTTTFPSAIQPMAAKAPVDYNALANTINTGINVQASMIPKAAASVKQNTYTPSTSGGAAYKGVPITATDQAGIQAQMAAVDNQGYVPPAKLAPQNFNPTVPSTLDSGALSSGYNGNSLSNAYGQKVTNMQTNPQLTPSDALMQKIFENKQYTPEETNTLQNLSDVNTQITSTQLAARRQIKQLQEDGQLTKEQAQGFLSESQRRSDAQLADLAVAQTANTNSLSVQAAIRNNQLGAYQTLFDMTRGSQVLSPGQSLYSSTGQQVAGAQGIAPQVTSLATQLYSQAASTGNIMVDQNGQPNFGAYLQQASQLTGLPLPPNVYQGGSSQTGPSGISQGQQNGAGTYGSGGYGNIQQLPAQFQKYAVQAPLSPTSGQDLFYIDESKVPEGVRQTVKNTATAAGIPYLDEQGVGAFQAAQQILNVVDSIKALSIKNLKPGTTGRIQNSLVNWANNYLQFNPDLSNFAQQKDAAAKATTALSGGKGSGFRMNGDVIDAAIQNLPLPSDNLETALTKADALATQIINGLKPAFPNITSGNYGNLLQSQYSGGATQNKTTGGWASLGD